MDSVSPFALVLVGQPTLRARLRLGTFAALDQRVGLRYALPPMALADTGEYVTHHLRLAGRSDTLFSDDAIARIHKAGWGLPRAVNNLAVQACSPPMSRNRPWSTTRLPGRRSLR